MSAKHLVTVLVADDEAVVNELIKSQVRKLGYAVAGSAFDGPEAVTLACQLRPSVVLMDIQMTDPRTGMDDPLAGVAAAGEISRRCPVPVILLSAHETADLVRKASAAGVAAYLVKPVHENDLDRAITVALARFGDMMALREAEERFRTFADFTYDWEIWIDGTGVLQYMSPSCERVTGYTRADFQGDPTLLDRVIHPDDREQAVAAMRESHAAGGHCALDFRIVHRSGEHRWIAHVCQPVSGRDGRPLGRRISNRDVSDRKLAEERLRGTLAEKELLLHEIHHRVKDNLHIISSLLALQADSVGDSPVRGLFRDAHNRVKSMAFIHDRLYHSGSLSHIDFGEYMKSLTEQLRKTYDVPQVEIALDVAGVQVSVEVAIPCGLIANELISNALKHAFQEGRRGTVEVSLRSPRKGEYVLTVGDDGPGLPAAVDPGSSRSLGLHLVTLLAEQMNGGAEWSSGPGTTVVVTLREPPPR